MSNGNLKNAGKVLLRRVFEMGQGLGFDLLPRHFYSEIPDVKALRTTKTWRRARSMDGIPGAALDDQLEFVSRCTAPFREAVADAGIHHKACITNGEPGYGAIEADFLYSFIRSFQPPAVVQVGCGVSTAVMLLASADAGYKPRMICIEPYPTQFLRSSVAAGTLELVQEKFQETSFNVQDSIGNDGLFFVDSSHALGPAGEVSDLILEALPKLKPGAWAHFHDIAFPYDYSPYVLSTDLFFQHESALLYAFLLMNTRFRIAASLAMLSHRRQAELQQLLPNFQPAKFEDGLMIADGHFPSSIYLRAS